MQTLVILTVVAALAALLVLGGFLVSWEVFLRYVEGRTFSGNSGLFLSLLPDLLVRFGLGIIAGGILAILTYRGHTWSWAVLMSFLATAATVRMSGRMYFVEPDIIVRILKTADPFMFIPGAVLGAVVVAWALRLTMASTGRGVSSGPAKPGGFLGRAG